MQANAPELVPRAIDVLRGACLTQVVVPTTLEVSAKIVWGIPERHIAIIDIPIRSLQRNLCATIHPEFMDDANDAKQTTSARPAA